MMLSRALSTSPMLNKVRGAVVVVRPGPIPMIGVLCYSDDVTQARLEALSWYMSHALTHMRFVSYSQAEQDCERLAQKLINCFGREEVNNFRFFAVPRGGFIVLGMLSYTLGLHRAQLEQPFPNDVPLVVVDDCAISGYRFRQFMEHCKSSQVIFAHLYSHPDLRTSIESRESRVLACLSVHDLHDYAPKRLGNEYPVWRKRLLARLRNTRYWIGQPEHICFAWNEPDISFWNPVTRQDESGWRFLPRELCLKNHRAYGMAELCLRVQPEGKGPLKPSTNVLFADFEGQIVVADVQKGISISLTGVASDMWQAIVEHGNLKDVEIELLRNYDMDKLTIRKDLNLFVEDLFARGLIEKSDA